MNRYKCEMNSYEFKEQYLSDTPMQTTAKEELLKHLLKYRGIIYKKIHSLGNLKHWYDLNSIGLCCNDKNLMYILDQEFERHELGYYSLVGTKIEDELLTKKNKYRFYRFVSYEKRLEFAENLIKELEQSISL